MIPENVLAQLRDIQQPPPASWWPPAPGWWLLAALTLVLAAAMTILCWRRYQRHRPRRQALQRLAAYPQTQQPGPQWYAGLNRLLKETAIARYPTDNPAAMSGEQWSDFLALTSGLPDRPWSELVTASYRPGASLPPADALELVNQWIRRQPW